MTGDEAYGVLTAIGRLTDAMTKVEAQRDQALAEVHKLRGQLEEAAPPPDGGVSP